MNTVTFKKVFLWGDGTMTMNTQGELIFTMEIKTLYYIWNVPIWKTTKYRYGTKPELQKEMMMKL